jgi:5-methylcytosine-specific restriction endonuclease McrA
MGKDYHIRPGDIDRVAKKSDYRCWYCGAELYNSVKEHRITSMKPIVTIDHFTPQSLHGSSDISNLVAACHGCNASKGNRDIESMRFRIESKTGKQHFFYFEVAGLSL